MFKEIRNIQTAFLSQTCSKKGFFCLWMVILIQPILLVRPFALFFNLVNCPFNGELPFHIRTFTVWKARPVTKAYHRILGKRTGFLSSPLMWKLLLLVYAKRPEKLSSVGVCSENALFGLWYFKPEVWCMRSGPLFELLVAKHTSKVFIDIIPGLWCRRYVYMLFGWFLQSLSAFLKICCMRLLVFHGLFIPIQFSQLFDLFLQGKLPILFLFFIEK